MQDADVSAALLRIAQHVQQAGWSSPTPPGHCWVATHAAGSTVTRCERWEAIVQRWRELPAQPPEGEHLVIALRTDGGALRQKGTSDRSARCFFLFLRGSGGFCPGRGPGFGPSRFRLAALPSLVFHFLTIPVFVSCRKLAVQCGHAVQYVLTEPPPRAEEAALLEWLSNGCSTKVVLGADERQWTRIKLLLIREVLRHVLVTDHRHTEAAFQTETVIGLWPMRRSAAPKLVRCLQVLRENRIPLVASDP